MLATVGITMTDAEVLQTFVGRSAAAALTIIEERLGSPLPSSFLGEWHTQLFAEFHRGVAPMPDVVTVLDALDAGGLPTCVASSGGHDRMRLTLGTSGLLPRFDGRLFSATEVPRGKPFPDVFLHAARRMGVLPERAVVIEDSVAGVTAGVAAGMTVFGYTAGAHSDPAELTAAGARTFAFMAELPALLGATSFAERPPIPPL